MAELNKLQMQVWGRKAGFKFSLIYSDTEQRRINKTKEDNFITFRGHTSGGMYSLYNNNGRLLSQDTFPTNINSNGAILSSNGSVYSFPNRTNAVETRRKIYKIETNPESILSVYEVPIGGGTPQITGAVEDSSGIIWFFPRRYKFPIVKLDSSDDSTSTFNPVSLSTSDYGLSGNAVIIGNTIYVLICQGTTGIWTINTSTGVENFYSNSFSTNEYRSLEIGNDGNLYSSPYNNSTGYLLKFNVTSKVFSLVAIPYVYTTSTCLGLIRLGNGLLMGFPQGIDFFAYVYDAILNEFKEYDIPTSFPFYDFQTFDFVSYPKVTFVSNGEGSGEENKYFLKIKTK